MGKILYPTLFHKTTRYYFGLPRQEDKVIEELEELREAVLSKDRERIIKELADVENILPYLQLSFLYDAEIRMEHLPDNCDLMMYLDLVTGLLYSRKKSGGSYLLKRIIHLGITGLCQGLYDLYVEYKINPREVEEIIDYKRRRTIKRIASGYYKES